MLFGLLVVAAIIAQFAAGTKNPSFQTANFFSFFTIQSNVLAALTFIVASWGALKNKRNNMFALLRGAATLYMATTGIVYVLLLSGYEETLQTTIPWVNFVLHYLMPVAVVADWFIDRPPFRILFKHALLWLIFPIFYLAYSLIRGSLTGWYPYPFLNPGEQGYASVAATCIFIALGATVFAWLLSKTARPSA